MRAGRLWMAPLCFMLACGEKEGDDSAPGDDSASADDSGSADDTAGADDSGARDDTGGGEGLPDLLDGVDEDYCDVDGDYPDRIGATSYFWGEYFNDGAGNWTGEERWLLFATAEWEAVGGSDCQVTWVVSGSDASPGACGGCEYGVRISAALDAGRTSCPSDLYAGQENFNVTYGVDQLGDGEVAVYFASTGNPYGAGYERDGAFNLITDRSCSWF